MLLFSTVAGVMASTNMVTQSIGKVTGEMDYTHTILGEFGTATWCPPCRYAHGALKNLYIGEYHPFYYVSLVCDKNTHAYQRAITELGLTAYPTVFWDGGYKKNVGASSIPGAMAAYNGLFQR